MQLAGRKKPVDQVFILRFWREEDGHMDATSLWRARVTDVNTGRELHADGIDMALTIVRSLLTTETDDRRGA
jgi:hypothetical protein